MVISVQDIQLTAHKDAHPSDSEDNIDIGLSSEEEEAEDLAESPHIRRKFVPLPVPPQPQPAPSTSRGVQPTSRYQWKPCKKCSSTLGKC